MLTEKQKWSYVPYTYFLCSLYKKLFRLKKMNTLYIEYLNVQVLREVFNLKTEQHIVRTIIAEFTFLKIVSLL